MGEQGLSDRGDDAVAQVLAEIQSHDLSSDPAGEGLDGKRLRPRRFDCDRRSRPVASSCSPLFVMVTAVRSYRS